MPANASIMIKYLGNITRASVYLNPSEKKESHARRVITDTSAGRALSTGRARLDGHGRGGHYVRGPRERRSDRSRGFGHHGVLRSRHLRGWIAARPRYPGSTVLRCG